MKNPKLILTDKFILIAVIISVAVSLLIHFPELIAIFDFQNKDILFSEIPGVDLMSEIIFTFISLMLLFGFNSLVFHFNTAGATIGWKKTLLSFFLTWILSNIFATAFVYLHHTFHIPAIDASIHHYLHPLRDFIITCIVTGSSYIIYLIRRQQQVVIENQQLTAENNLSQYKTLKNQLNPHMLFNSLNTLRSLVREDENKAQNYIQELSRVLRYTLQDNDAQRVTLREEMEFVSAYTFLMKMRYEDNLLFDIQINKRSEDCYLPPMAVQMLVENAIKHNEISDRNPLTISIYSDDRQGITVSNAIQQKRNSSPGTGIGLVNLAKRYQLLFQQNIDIKKNKDFTVHLPLIENIP